MTWSWSRPETLLRYRERAAQCITFDADAVQPARRNRGLFDHSGLREQVVACISEAPEQGPLTLSFSSPCSNRAPDAVVLEVHRFTISEDGLQAVLSIPLVASPGWTATAAGLANGFQQASGVVVPVVVPTVGGLAAL